MLSVTNFQYLHNVRHIMEAQYKMKQVSQVSLTLMGLPRAETFFFSRTKQVTLVLLQGQEFFDHQP